MLVDTSHSGMNRGPSSGTPHTSAGTDWDKDKAKDDPFVEPRNKEEAIAMFKMLLDVSGIQAHYSWDQTHRVIANKPQFKALKTHGERRGVFNEWVEDRKRTEETQERERREKTKAEFWDMLGSGEVGSTDNYRYVWRLLTHTKY